MGGKGQPRQSPTLSAKVVLWPCLGSRRTLYNSLKAKQNIFEVTGFFLNLFRLVLQHNESSRRVFFNPVPG